MKPAKVDSVQRKAQSNILFEKYSVWKLNLHLSTKLFGKTPWSRGYIFYKFPIEFIPAGNKA